MEIWFGDGDISPHQDIDRVHYKEWEPLEVGYNFKFDKQAVRKAPEVNDNKKKNLPKTAVTFKIKEIGTGTQIGWYKVVCLTNKNKPVGKERWFSHWTIITHGSPLEEMTATKAAPPPQEPPSTPEVEVPATFEECVQHGFLPERGQDNLFVFHDMGRKWHAVGYWEPVEDRADQPLRVSIIQGDGSKKKLRQFEVENLDWLDDPFVPYEVDHEFKYMPPGDEWVRQWKVIEVLAGDDFGMYMCEEAVSARRSATKRRAPVAERKCIPYWAIPDHRPSSS